jgi:hypothetical protein
VLSIPEDSEDDSDEPVSNMISRKSDMETYSFASSADLVRPVSVKMLVVFIIEIVLA